MMISCDLNRMCANIASRTQIPHMYRVHPCSSISMLPLILLSVAPRRWGLLLVPALLLVLLLAFGVVVFLERHTPWINRIRSIGLMCHALGRTEFITATHVHYESPLETTPSLRKCGIFAQSRQEIHEVQELNGECRDLKVLLRAAVVCSQWRSNERF